MALSHDRAIGLLGIPDELAPTTRPADQTGISGAIRPGVLGGPLLAPMRADEPGGLSPAVVVRCRSSQRRNSTAGPIVARHHILALGGTVPEHRAYDPEVLSSRRQTTGEARGADAIATIRREN